MPANTGEAPDHDHSSNAAPHRLRHRSSSDHCRRHRIPHGPGAAGSHIEPAGTHRPVPGRHHLRAPGRPHPYRSAGTDPPGARTDGPAVVPRRRRPASAPGSGISAHRRRHPLRPVHQRELRRPPSDDLLALPTHSRQDAAAIANRRPILLFSHSYGVSVALNTGLHEQLASHGYVVAGIDHTYDAGAVEFPDGRVVSQKPDIPIDDLLRSVRTADTLFVLDRLIQLVAAGRNPAAGSRLPHGLHRTLDPTRIGGYGHSLGSPTIVTAMQLDRRIDAGAGLDGDLRDGDLTGTGLGQPLSRHDLSGQVHQVELVRLGRKNFASCARRCRRFGTLDAVGVGRRHRGGNAGVAIPTTGLCSPVPARCP
ncbi:hypothetical protein ACIA5D_43840 [Actinoplanes sp. NPDC051513]|uniref:alpha/beta hydrolase n=1 Tax=Actinoplanes sp. NPDC051513 TaxID=3363908 RepID=UPI00378FFA94